MSPLLALYRRLDRLQRTRSFRIGASIVAFVVCAALFGPLLSVSGDLEGHRRALNRELADQSLAREDDHALSLARTGTVTVDGRVYGSEERIARLAPMFFDADGNLIGQGQLVEELISDLRPAWAPAFLVEDSGTTLLLGLLVTGWLLLVVWMEISVPLLLTVLGTAVPVSICWMLGREGALLAFAGMGLLTFTFVLLTRAVLILFNFPLQPFAVAHTVVKEASRSRISLIFVILLLVILPLIPVTIDAGDPLRYRIQAFISRSLFWTGLLAGAMTLFLSCATVAFEVRDRQIWQLMTKPLSRFNYLAGKWLGVVSINLVILVVTGVSIFSFTKYLSQLPVASGVAGYEDRLAVRDEVLTARLGRIPEYQRLESDQLRARVNQIIERDPMLSVLDEVPRARKNQIAREIQEEVFEAQRSVLPNNGAQTYVFTGLGSARSAGSTLTLRYRFHIMRDDEHERFPVVFVINEQTEAARLRSYVPTVTHIERIDPQYVRPDGTLSITVVNTYRPPERYRGRGELNFEADDFELLYKAGHFETNFFRAMCVTWTKLAFVAMLGVAGATLLSFPVSVLLTFTIVMGAIMSPFLAASLQEYYPPDPGRMDWSNFGEVIKFLVMSAVRGIAQFLVFTLGRFGEYRPGQSLIEGRLISWSTVAGGVFWLGVVWSGITACFGYLVLRNRQLAIYSGHG